MWQPASRCPGSNAARIAFVTLDVQTSSNTDGTDGVRLQSAAAVQFPLAHPAVSAMVPGAVRPEEVDANVRLIETPIPADVWAELKREGLLREDAPTPG